MADNKELMLFNNKLARKPEFWQFIKMIAPSGRSKPVGGWTVEDCVGLYCERCKARLKYTKNDSKIIRRHMQTKHAKELKYFNTEKSTLESKKRKAMDDFLCPVTKKSKTAAGSMEQKAIKDLCIKWVSRSYRPIQIIENDGLADLIDFVNRMKNAAELPGRTSLSETIRENTENKRMELLDVLAQEADFF